MHMWICCLMHQAAIKWWNKPILSSIFPVNKLLVMSAGGEHEENGWYLRCFSCQALWLLNYILAWGGEGSVCSRAGSAPPHSAENITHSRVHAPIRLNWSRWLSQRRQQQPVPSIQYHHLIGLHYHLPVQSPSLPCILSRYGPSLL